MPKDGYESITLPEELVEELDALRYEDSSSNRPNYSYADVIRRLLAAQRKNKEQDGTGRYDGAHGVEVVRIDSAVIDDIASMTANSVANELEERNTIP